MNYISILYFVDWNPYKSSWTSVGGEIMAEMNTISQHHCYQNSPLLLESIFLTSSLPLASLSCLNLSVWPLLCLQFIAGCRVEVLESQVMGTGCNETSAHSFPVVS